MSSLIYSHFLNVDNAGDIYSCPLDYFKVDFQQSQKIDFNSLTEAMNFDLVLGGGGMLHDNIINEIEKLSQNKKRKIIIWGAGLNEHDTIKQTYPKFLDTIDMVGLRDYKNPYEYVPCSSCMSHYFNIYQTILSCHSIIVFEHKDLPIPLMQFPKRSNRIVFDENLGDILRFISSGETIITNTYHGAYWSLLLNKKVLIWEPFSNRFLGLKPNVTFCNKIDWQQKLSDIKHNNENYLIECRDINMKFCAKVKKLLF